MRQLVKLRRLVRPYWWHIVGALAALVVVTATQLAIPRIIEDVIDIGLAQGEIRFMIQAAGVILGIGLLRAIFAFVQRYLSEYVSMKVAYDLRNWLFNHIQHLSFTYHDRASTGQLMSRCTEDVGAIQRFLGFGAVELSQALFMAIGAMGLMLTSSPRLALIAIIPILPLVLLTTSFGGRVSKMFYDVDWALGSLSSRLQENAAGAQVVRAFAREPYEVSRFARVNRKLFDARIHVISEWSKVMPTSHLLISLSTILILFFGGRMVLNDEITVGQLVAFNSYLLLLANPVQQLTWLVNAAGEAAAGAQRAFEVLDRPSEIQSAPEAVETEALKGLVEFKDVHFTYEGEQIPALSDINIAAEPNQVVALIGPTGSGKTSLVNLIPRFYDVSSGAVLVDGQDIRSIDVQVLRRQIGIVLQSSLLFSATIRENIALGRPDADEEQILAAARAAEAHEFILNTADGYDTVVGERGVTLSGGQRQRIAIARALLIDPSILILDDSTSSVDMETEHLIQKALDELMRGRTTFVIAQRLSTVRNADQILVMDQGRIIERGQHEALLEKRGLYKEIYDLQLAEQEQFRETIAQLEKN
ncbi:MAG: ABC transporter ATP-binding protein [Chloroflexi bacterium]|nr:MAG: ABC transporter ATP-binding protein [Chloroflexota bacterium]MBL1195284.1 ABC transporter ATP-binding protein [Chloroflexota bacterium]NOH12568.1 ABC transporter ATP-binding protein [Chloroflexota bacterium]